MLRQGTRLLLLVWMLRVKQVSHATTRWERGTVTSQAAAMTAQWSTNGTPPTHATTPAAGLDIADYPCHQGTAGINIYYAVFLAVTIIVTVVGNSLVCFSVYMSRALQERSTNLFLVSLAISDIMVGLVTLPIKLKQTLDNQLFCMDVSACWLLTVSDSAFSVASVTNLVVVALDRFIAITRPYDYGRYMSCDRANYIIAGVWFYALSWSLLSIFKWHEPSSLSTAIIGGNFPFCFNDNRLYFTAVYGCVFVLPLVAISVMYATILKVALKQIKAITTLDVGRAVGRRRREFRATRTVAVVFVVFVVCWLPVCVISVSGMWFPEHYKELRDSNEDLFLGIYMAFVQVLPPLNSTANPFIYAIFNRTFRAAFKTIVFRLFGRNARTHNFELSVTQYPTANGVEDQSRS